MPAKIEWADCNLLDNIGITIEICELPSRSDYKKSIVSLCGKGRLSHFWMRYIFRRLRPAEWQRRHNKYEQLRRQIQQEFMCAVMEAANDVH